MDAVVRQIHRGLFLVLTDPMGFATIPEKQGGNYHDSLQKALQKGETEAGCRETEYLGQPESGDPEARQQQGLQSKQSPELEA